jgi:YfiH family protein
MLTCPALSQAGFLHAFATRAEGNLSLHHGTSEMALENRRLLLAMLDRPDWPIVTLKQTHSDVILQIDSLAAGEDAGAQPEGDALLTAEPDRFIGVMTADCVPVLIADPKTKSMAAVHAGWRGTLRRITEKTVHEMESRFNSRAEDLIAAVGPSACGRCYEVGEEVGAAFKEEFADTRAFLISSATAGKFLLNTPAANATQLIQSKVRAENVHVLPYCTMHQNDLFFSYRQDGGVNQDMGRQLSVIGLPQEKFKS